MDTVQTIRECRICKSRNIVPFIETRSKAYPGAMSRYCVCNDCDTVLEEGNLLVHYTESCQPCNIEDALQHTLEIGECIEFMAHVILAAHSLKRERKEGERNRFLDIGCGFGFSSSIAQFLGWEPIGIEPTQIGVFGAKMLGVPILHTTLENADLTPGYFDYVYSSEVIEHVQDVDSFVSTAARYLKPDGLLMLTTPNAQALRGFDAVEREWMESLYPGYHVNVLSPTSLEMVLRRNGMSSVQIILSAGTSGRKRMIAFASRSAYLPSIPWKELDLKGFVRSYLEHLVSEQEKKQEFDSLYCGALYRLIELLINAGAYAEAECHMAKLDGVLIRQARQPEKYWQVQATNIKEYLSQVPAFAGLYAYFKGIFYLNYRADFSNAEKWFRIGQHFCAVEGKIEPSNMYSRLYWPEKCRFHAGLALLYRGRQREALREFEALLSQPEQLPQEMQDKLLYNKAIALLQLGESLQAAHYFANTWLDRCFADTPSHLLPLRHMILALTQEGERRGAKLQAIDERNQQVQQQIGQQVAEMRQIFDELAARVDAGVLPLRPLWRLSRPVAKRLLALARTGRSGYRWLRHKALAAKRSSHAATDPMAAQNPPPPQLLETPLLGTIRRRHAGSVAMGCRRLHFRLVGF